MLHKVEREVMVCTTQGNAQTVSLEHIHDVEDIVHTLFYLLTCLDSSVQYFSVQVLVIYIYRYINPVASYTVSTKISQL